MYIFCFNLKLNPTNKSKTSNGLVQTDTKQILCTQSGYVF